MFSHVTSELPTILAAADLPLVRDPFRRLPDIHTDTIETDHHIQIIFPVPFAI